MLHHISKEGSIRTTYSLCKQLASGQVLIGGVLRSMVNSLGSSLQRVNGHENISSPTMKAARSSTSMHYGRRLLRIFQASDVKSKQCLIRGLSCAKMKILMPQPIN